MAKRRIIKRIFLLLGFLVLLLIIAAATFQLWLPYVIKPIASRFGVHYKSFEKLENGRFAITELVRTNRAFDLEISRIEGFLPLQWYQHVKKHETNDPPVFLHVNGWRAVIHDPPERADRPDRPQRSVYDYYNIADQWIHRVREWIPSALLQNGILEFQQKEYAFGLATWSKGRFEANGIWPVSAVPMVIKARLTPDQPYQLSFAMHPLDLRLRLQATETNNLLATKLTGFYKESRADLAAEFGREGRLPMRATLKSDDFKLPAETLKIQHYQELTGDLAAEWNTNQYTLTLQAHAEPYVSNTNNLPPIDIDLAASGDTNKVRIEKATSTAPGLQLTMSHPIELTYRGKLLSGTSEIKIDADLEKIPGLDLGGHVQGTILLKPGEKIPALEMKASGTNLSVQSISFDRAEIVAALDWPLLEQFELQVRGDSNSTLSISGRGDLLARTISAARVTGSGQVQTNLLPAGIDFDTVAFEGTFSGPITNLNHSARAEITGFRTPQLAPLNLELDWQAQQAAFERLALRARAGPATLTLQGEGNVEPGTTNLTLNQFTLAKGDEEYLTLAQPARLSLTATNLGTNYVFLAAVDDFQWRGQERSLQLSADVAWPRAGHVSLAATNINPELFQFFFTRSLSGLDLQRLSMDARWNEGPLMGWLNTQFSFIEETFERIAAEVLLEIDQNGLSLTDLSVDDATGKIVEARGFLPVAIHPLDPVKPIHLAEQENIDFTLKTAPNPAFWDRISNLTRVKFADPAVGLHVGGTTRNPNGNLQFRFSSLSLVQTNGELPRVGEIEGNIALNEAVLRIPNIRAEVEGQPVNIRGETRLGENFWELPPDAIRAYLITNSSLRVVAKNLDVAPFARFLPEYLAPQGTVQLNAGVQPGVNFNGTISVDNVSTRPLPKVGVVQDIQAQLHFDQKLLRVDEVSGVLGGQRLLVTGNLDLSNERFSQSYPGINLAIRGTNVPLARNPDIILRTDLDLVVTNSENSTPIIAGVVNLRDSFLLRDITTLVPGRVARPSRRPPYFSIPHDPMDEWLLNVRVRGDNFMRVRSPFFQGQVSANFLVSGTLEEPRALGEARLPEGTITFPFANLQVRQGLVSLSTRDPYLPRIFVIAQGRAYGYDITMQAEGPANEPIIEFSSVPSLTSEEIVLLLTTGQIPRSDFSYTNQERASRLAFFLGKSLWQKVNPNAAEEQRLIIRSGEDISEQGRTTYSVEYKLNDNWSLIGEYDRFGDLNADVKWRIFSR